ncbi:uncharacterized protein LOC130446674 isoform X1 [Diorhabda sublineata]|uniref:uncharacterized protein LOC130446674 isoform X1 n=1 Tax=Diorhabda sublineata TaxID=1163346 RepID=UPI0024E0FBEA|nr:uncharacterized protein LOC130446674 isoform X1 [Diorhabda sublineata]
MALGLHKNRSLYECLRRTITTNIFSLSSKNVHGKMLSIEVDSMDTFTTQLIQKKVDKWSAMKSVTKKSYAIKIEEDSSPDKLQLSSDQINTLFKEFIDLNDSCKIFDLIQQCIALEICPSLSHLLYALSVCSQCGNVDTIRRIQDLCKKTNPSVLEPHSYFKHYIAEAIWIKGNIHEALILLKEVYQHNTLLRRRVRLIWKNLIVDIVASRSKAVLISIINFAEYLAKEYKDYFPLACVWQICFLSEWYSDQCEALVLLSKHEELRKNVISRISYVVAISLQNHRTDVVYRLLETLLKYEMKTQYSGVLLSLLDYQMHQKDLRRCIEIIQWSVQNEVQLLPNHHEKFLKLFITSEEHKVLLKKFKPVTIPKTLTNYKF